MTQPPPPIALCGYDATSREAGAALGAMLLWREHFAMHAEAAPQLRAHQVRTESRNSAIYCRAVRQAADVRGVRFALGGDHLITFPLIEVARARHPGLKIVVLDAHHDAYDYPLLTHYSLFHHAIREGSEVLVVGARHELELAVAGCHVISDREAKAIGADAVLGRIRAFLADAPSYLSLDVDVLDPREFPAVSSPVPGGLSIPLVTTLVRGALALDPIGADVVEYNPVGDDGRTALASLAPIMQEYRSWLMR